MPEQPVFLAIGKQLFAKLLIFFRKIKSPIQRSGSLHNINQLFISKRLQNRIVFFKINFTFILFHIQQQIKHLADSAALVNKVLNIMRRKVHQRIIRSERINLVPVKVLNSVFLAVKLHSA